MFLNFCLSVALFYIAYDFATEVGRYIHLKFGGKAKGKKAAVPYSPHVASAFIALVLLVLGFSLLQAAGAVLMILYATLYVFQQRAVARYGFLLQRRGVLGLPFSEVHNRHRYERSERKVSREI